MNEGIIEGQISIFDLPIEDIKSKEKKSKIAAKIISNPLKDIINIYSESCSRIVKTFSGSLLVELDDKTLYINSKGINEFNLPINVGIMPGEEILIANKDKELNSIQKQKLEDLKVKEYIKRKGDANIIIPGEKTIVINPKGWVLEYNQKPMNHSNEIFNTEFNLKINEINDRKNKIAVNIIDIDFKVGDEVIIKYQGAKAIGKVVRIYNKGETLNIMWDGKQTAFYYKNVEKVK